MKSILQAPVDLLWNGGIGTYVKAAGETNADGGRQGQRRHPRQRPRPARPVRGGGRQLRAHPLPVGSSTPTVAGRINTDFIDNSAGVDTSDHEVNIKILLDRVVANGDLTEKQRNAVLAQMTDEVAALVLRDNYEQNLALANAAAANAPSLLHVHEDWMRRLEKRGCSTASLEGLPTTRQVRRMLERGIWPQRAGASPALLAWTKIVLAEELLDSDLPDDPYCHVDLTAYFPRDPRGLHRPGRRAPAAPRDHRDPGGQRPGEQRGHDLLAAPAGRDRRRAGEPGPAPTSWHGRSSARWRSARRSCRTTTSSRRRCRPGCASTCAPWSSGRRAGW